MGAAIVRQAEAGDIAALAAFDHHIDPIWVERCVAAGEYFIAAEDGVLVGLLRYSWFWRSIPYMELIAVREDRRRSGVGTALFLAWENAMRMAGAALLMTSAMSDEPEPLAWHRRNGFQPSGALTFGAVQTVAESFLVKDI